MKLTVTTGYMVCTARHKGLTHDKLLMVKTLNTYSKPNGQHMTAVGNIGTGRREWAPLASGSSARQTHAQGTPPADLYVIDIVDKAAADGQMLPHKQSKKS